MDERDSISNYQTFHSVTINTNEFITAPCLTVENTIAALFYDLTRDSIAYNFVIDFYCRCLKILYQIAINCKI